MIIKRLEDMAERVGNVSGEAVVYDIAQIVNTLWGYLPAKVPGLPQPPSNINEFKAEQKATPRTSTLKGSPIYGQQDMIGREVFCPLTISAGGVDYEFPFVVIGVRNKKLIVETPMIERNGAVIEEIGLAGYSMSVKGFIVDPNNEFPDEQLNRLKEMFETNEPIIIKNALTDIFLERDDRVVMRDLNIPEKAKVIGVRDFSFELVQDGVFDLYSVD